MNTGTDQIYNIYYEKDSQLVVMDWDGYATSEQFREGTETMLNILIENKATKVLADAKDMVLIAGDDQKWLETKFIPRAIRFGFKVCAIVRPHSYFNKVAVESFSYRVDQERFTISFFDTSEEARAWLSTQ